MKNVRYVDMRIDLDALIKEFRGQYKPDETLLRLLGEADDLYDQAIHHADNEFHARHGRQVGAFYHAETFEQILKQSLMGPTTIHMALALLCSMSFRAGIRVAALARARGVTLWTGIDVEKTPS